MGSYRVGYDWGDLAAAAAAAAAAAVHPYNMISFSLKNEILTHATTWINLRTYC